MPLNDFPWDGKPLRRADGHQALPKCQLPCIAASSQHFSGLDLSDSETSATDNAATRQTHKALTSQGPACVPGVLGVSHDHSWGGRQPMLYTIDQAYGIAWGGSDTYAVRSARAAAMY